MFYNGKPIDTQEVSQHESRIEHLCSNDRLPKRSTQPTYTVGSSSAAASGPAQLFARGQVPPSPSILTSDVENSGANGG